MVDVLPGENKFDNSKFNAFCKENNFIFPEPYVKYLQVYNDGKLELNYIKIPDNEITIRYFYGTSEDKIFDLKANYQVYQDRLPSKCVPVAADDCGNLICMSVNTETYGKIYFWDHETMDMNTYENTNLQIENLILISDSFEELCAKINPFDVKDIPKSSAIQIKWNRFVSWLRTL